MAILRSKFSPGEIFFQDPNKKTEILIWVQGDL